MIRQNIIPQILIYGLGTHRLMSSEILNTDSVLEVGNRKEKEVKQERSSISISRIYIDSGVERTLSKLADNKKLQGVADSPESQAVIYSALDRLEMWAVQAEAKMGHTIGAYTKLHKRAQEETSRKRLGTSFSILLIKAVF